MTPEKVLKWEESGTAKIVLGCRNAQHLNSLKLTAENKEVNFYASEYALAVGPDLAEKVNEVTGELRLY